jgi:radical SAM protein with 4Fe4S-binding SPASM domain
MPGSLWERLERENGFPMRVMLSLTERCPLKCGHCYLADHGATDELSFGEIERLFDELTELGVFHLSLTGGEPGMRPDLPAIVEAAWKRRFLVSLKTSASLFERSDVERLREVGLSALHVSLYHDVAAEHDRFVGMQGAWQRAVNALEGFRRLKGISILASVLMDWNESAVVPLVRMARLNDWTITVDPKVHRVNDGDDRSVRLRSVGPRLEAAMRGVPDSRRRAPAPEPDQSICNAGTSSVYITSSGDVWLCPVIPVSIGNIRERQLGEIWEGSSFRKEIAALVWSDTETCMTCENNGFCERCPGEAYLEHGEFARPATVDCRIAEAYAAIWASGG